MFSIETASSGHRKCFICNRAGLLKSIRIDSVAFAYSNNNILIKEHARCCSRHLDHNGLIYNECYNTIPTKMTSHNIAVKKKMEYIIGYLNSKNSGVFDKFRDMSALSEEHCFKITGWTKSEFIRFTKYITSLNDSRDRTKEEIIAIYRFWLRRGIDQCSLALLKNTKSSECYQRDISRYLDQARTAIHNDFVPSFLGCKRSRKFYLQHNSATTQELFQLGKKDLSVVADGTYTGCKKSANNNFQYKSYSVQKKGSLIKPFIICTTDGYILDVYGPFAANLNDAIILDSILKTDQDLIRILKPNTFKTYIFLDRGIILL